MSSAGEAQHLTRLGTVLDDRGATVEPVLAAVTRAGTASAILAASARSRRLDLLIPFDAAALAIVAPNAAVPPAKDRAMLRISVDGATLGAARVIAGSVSPAEAVAELAPPGDARAAWTPIVETLCGSSGKITGRTTSLTELRASIGVRYSARTAEAEATLVTGVDEVATRLGLDASQRALWQRLHASFGPTVTVSVATHCTPRGPTAELGFVYVTTAWDRAVQLARDAFDLDAARGAAASLGKLAGTLESEQLMAVELVVGPDGPDVIAWVRLNPS